MKNKKVPLILQMEATECGAASLGMILAYYGRRIPLEKLRAECGVSRDGVNAKNIRAAARSNGLTAKAFKCSMESIGKVKLPAVIHWNMEHFVVLYGVDKKGFYIADPARGYVKVSESEFSKSFTGIVLVFEPSEDFKTDQTVGVKKESFIMSFLKSEITAFITAMILLAIISAINFYIPFFNSVFIDKILMNGNMLNLKLLIKFVAVTAAVVISAIAAYINISYEISKRIETNINANFMWRIIKYPIGFFSQRNPGELSSRQSNNMHIAQEICASALPIPVDIVMILIYISVFFSFDCTIGIIGLMSVVLNIVFIMYVSKSLSGNMTLSIRNDGVLYGNISSSVNMIETIKACGCENEIFKKLSGLGAECTEQKMYIAEKTAYLQAAFSIINNLTYSAVIVFGVYKVLSGEFTSGLLIGISGVMTAFLQPINTVTASMQSLQSLRGEIERAEDTMNYTYEPIFANESQGCADGSVHIENISFGYNELSPMLIENFSLDIEKGQSVAFMGGSGSGKSTMAKLIAGLYQPQRGKIRYGKYTAKELDEKYFYSHAAIVDQNICLFKGSIFDNISMWDKSITYETVVQAAKDACIHDDIMKRSGGYFNEVYSGGKNLSGGQRQKIEIARALAKNPDIIILDEATSALDTAVEQEIMNNIKKRGVTLIIIAHRLSTIRDCDNILVMNRGKVVEQGSHEVLMKNDNEYARLVRCR